jgi:Putative zinc-finger
MRYVLGELEPAARDEFEEHLADCSNCMNEVWTATTFAANAKEVFRTGRRKPARKPILVWLWRPSPAFAFSAALNVLLAAGLGYGLLRVIPGMRAEIAQLSLPAGVEVVSVLGVVRDASGTPQVVKAKGSWMVLSFDIAQGYGRYVYSVADESGRVVLSGEVPDAGSDSLNVPVRVGRLAPGEYRIAAAGIDGNRREELGTCLLQVPKR